MRTRNGVAVSQISAPVSCWADTAAFTADDAAANAAAIPSPHGGKDHAAVISDGLAEDLVMAG